MPEEQKEVQPPVPTPAPEQAAAPAAPASPQAAAAAPASKKGTNGCVIAIIVVAVIVVLTGVGIFLAYKFVKNKVSDTVKIDGDSASLNIGGVESGVSTGGDTYNDVTEQNPTNELIKQINDEIKPIFASVLGGAKTQAWASFDSTSGTLSYVSKNPFTSEDYTKIKDGLASVGYVSESDYNSSEGSVITASKGEILLSVLMGTGEEASKITVTIDQEIEAEPAQ